MKGTSIIVKTVARWVVAFILLYGLYVVAFGHLSPGGGFAGGVILACAFVLEVLAWGREGAFSIFPFGLAKRLDSAGAVLFLALALGGVLTAGGFFVNFVQRAAPGRPLALFNGGIIPLCNVAIALKVGASLFLVMAVLSALRLRPGGAGEMEALEEE